jgi:DnaJ domain/Restriction endonuclease
VGRDTYYEILGVSPTATQNEIKTKYRKLIQRIHPDLDGPTALFRQVQEAYEELSDPARRAAYDRSLSAQSALTRSASHRQAFERQARTASHLPGRSPAKAVGTSSPNRQLTGVVAIAGAFLLVFGVAGSDVGTGLIVVGALVVVAAAVAALGGRGRRERDAYLRSGMAAVDAMTGRQFVVLLRHFFANKGYRVGRIRLRNSTADLLLNDSQGRMIVHVRRWTDVVRHDVVQQAAVAMAHYGAARALVVTPSNYSPDAITVANSKGVVLWDGATLATELSAVSGERRQSGVKLFSSDLRAGIRICLGFSFATLFVTRGAVRTRASRLPLQKRRS